MPEYRKPLLNKTVNRIEFELLAIELYKMNEPEQRGWTEEHEERRSVWRNRAASMLEEQASEGGISDND